MITADTITDAQIRELARQPLTAQQHADCAHALQRRDRHWTRFQRTRQRGARSRCAELLMQRCRGVGHDHHAQVTCNGQCCAACGGPIDKNEECRC